MGGTLFKSSQLEDNIKVRGTLNVESLSTFKGDIYAIGQIGIGTNNAQADLHVNNANGVKFILSGNSSVIELKDNSATRGIIGYLSNSTHLTFEQVGQNGIAFRTNGQERMFMHSNGNVGIGTNDPKALLHVNGSIRGNQTSGAIRIQSDSGYIDIGSKNSSHAHIETDRSSFYFNKTIVINSGTVVSYHTSDIILATNSTTNKRVVIKNSTGNMGVGTEIPNERLDVAGMVRVREGVKVADSENDNKFEMMYNSTSRSLDFNFIG